MKSSITIHLDDTTLNQITLAVKEAIKEQLPAFADVKKDWLSTEEVMEMLNVSRRTVQNYRDEGKIPYTQDGRKILYPRDGVEDFLRANMVKAYR